MVLGSVQLLPRVGRPGRVVLEQGKSQARLPLTCLSLKSTESILLTPSRVICGMVVDMLRLCEPMETVKMLKVELNECGCYCRC